MAILAQWPQIIFFVIVVSWCLLFLVEFEDDGMRSNESTKNGRKGAHVLKCKIFVNSKTIFQIYDKKFHVSPTVLKISWFNLYGS